MNFTTRIKTLLLLLSTVWAGAAQAQIKDRTTRPIATILANVQLNHNEATATRPAGTQAKFEIQRAYLGYQKEISSKWSGRVLFDITNDSTLKGSHYNVYVKNAYLCYTMPEWQVYFGMVPTDLYTDAELHWAKRYMVFNVNELAGFGTSADLGVSVCYTPSDKWELRAQLLNGEGYRRVQGDSTFKGSLSVGYKLSKHFFVRGYGDVMNTNEKTQFTTNVFLGYTHPKVKLGAEAGWQWNQSGRKGHNMAIASLWGTYYCSPKVGIFLRGDIQEPTAKDVSEDTPYKWRDNKVQYRAMAGVDYYVLFHKITEQIRLSPNVQWTRTYAGHDQVTAYLSLGAFF